MAECNFKLRKFSVYKSLHVREKHAADDVAAWNAKVKVGDPVCVHRDNGVQVQARTMTAARVMGGTAVAWFTNISGCYALSHVHALASAATNG